MKRVELFNKPVTYYFVNRFVITEDRAWFVPYRTEFDWPVLRDILSEIFDLDDPEVYRDVRDRLAVSRIIVGDYYPKTKEVVIQVPLETNDYVEMRIREVFGQ